MDVVRRKRIVTTSGDDSDITYGPNERLRAFVTMLTGMAESFEHPGIFIRADALISFTPDVVIVTGDLLLIDDDWYEVKETLKRRTGVNVDWIEVLCNRRNPS